MATHKKEHSDNTAATGDAYATTDEKNAPDRLPSPYPRSQSLELTADAEDRIHNLARAFSGMSEVQRSNSTIVNPFDDHKIDALDPFSPAFDAEQWAKNYLEIVRNDPDRYLQRTAGISYTDLTVFGFGSDTDYQKDVINVVLHVANLAKKMFRPQWRVPILTDFEGIIRSGEMCVVLGRPGRQVSYCLVEYLLY